ncbi:MAG: hypothetical protein JO189_08090 [Deltaproteobacteria bacterium]|nr:hypothetical protein [Deltaproteobacteria bacterium]
MLLYQGVCCEKLRRLRVHDLHNRQVVLSLIPASTIIFVPSSDVLPVTFMAQFGRLLVAH